MPANELRDQLRERKEEMIFLAYLSNRRALLHSQFITLDGITALQSEQIPSSSLVQSPPAIVTSPSPSSSSRISPAVLFIIVILAVIFFVSGLLHLLVRFFIRKNSGPVSSPQSGHYQVTEQSGSEALQRQLQQLFHLHDSGLDQAFIDALPVFLYQEIIGSKEPFDCAVCLCEFTSDDHLRLLPVCGHAFHLNCIDTWLLSNSTCPLCRGALFVPGITIENPMFDFEEARDEEGCSEDREGGISLPRQKPDEADEFVAEKRVFPVRLGKFKRLSNGNDGTDADTGGCGPNDNAIRSEVGETSSSSLDARRCYSMGSYQYVVVDADLRVSLSNKSKRSDCAKNGKERGLNQNSPTDGAEEGKKLSIQSKGESFSVSKIWLWSNKKGKLPVPSDSSPLEGGFPWLQKNNRDV